ncbi:MAG: DUF2341 domain-containing protein, partial [Armatimonadia bacterium]|nr:DUF2341 domain-containing protein [Armatimonadia bacterium]
FWHWPSNPGISGAPAKALGFGHQGTVNWIWTDTDLATGQWYHIVGTYDANTPEQKMYVNGELQTKVGTYAWDLSNTDLLKIANGLDGPFDGKLDEIQLMKTPMNASWINASYHNQMNPNLFATVSTIDEIPPEINNVIITSDPLYSGQPVNISCSVTDNNQVNSVKLNISTPSGSTLNESMIGMYYYENIYTELGEYSYFIFAEDDSENRNVSSTYTFTILNSPPMIIDNDPSDQQTNIVFNPEIKSTIQDLETDNIEWIIQSNCSGSWEILNSGILTGSGVIKATSPDINTYNQKYYYSIHLRDPSGSNTWNNQTFTFTTLTEPTWYDSNWMYREPVMINTIEINSELHEFPVLIDIIDAGLSNYAQNDGDDILFTTISGIKLDHEIESFDKSTGHLVAWVKLSQLTGNSMIYLYFGNPQSSNQQNTASVWSDDFVMVQHLEETSGTHYDSTDSSNNGEPTDNPVQDKIGKINGANEFDGVYSKVHVNDADSLDLGINGTISAWFKMDVHKNFGGIIHKGDSDDWSDEAYALQFWNNNNLRFYIFNSGGDHHLETSTAISTNTWYHVAGSWNETGRYFYVNGIVDVSSTTAEAPRISIGGVNIGAQLVDDMGGSYRNLPFDGIIDEVRISNTSRNPHWMYINYLNQLDASSFISIAPVEGGGTDTQAPFMQNIQAQPSLQNIGGSVNISAEVTDLSLDNVFLNITYPDGITFVNTSIIGNNHGDIYHYEDTYIQEGIYSFFIWANDTNDNRITSTVSTFEIADIESPIISAITIDSTPKISGGNVNISCTVTDNKDIDTVLLHITKPDTTNYEVEMDAMTTTEFYNDTIYIDIGSYSFYITANDSANNVVTSITEMFNITSDGAPMITDHSASVTETGATFTINASVTDSDGLKTVKAEHWFT